MVLSVEDVGIYKPSRRVYRHAQHKLGLADALVGLFRLRQSVGCARCRAVRFPGVHSIARDAPMIAFPENHLPDFGTLGALRPR